MNRNIKSFCLSKKGKIRSARLLVVVALTALISSSVFLTLGIDTEQAVQMGASSFWGKRSTYLGLQSSSTSVEAGTNMHADGALIVKTSSGTAPITGATVRLSIVLPTGTQTTPSQGPRVSTDSNGKFSVDYAPATAGSYKLVATFSGSNGYSKASSTVTFEATGPEMTDPPIMSVPVSTRLTLNGEESTEVGSAKTIGGHITTGNGVGISGASLSITIVDPSNSTIGPIRAISNADGSFSYTFLPMTTGVHMINATYSGNESYQASSSVISFTVVSPVIIPSTAYDYEVTDNLVKNDCGTVVYVASDIAAALDWACTQAGKTTYVPAGHYYLSASIDFADGVTLMGDGAGRTIFTFSSIDGSQAYSRFQPTNVNDVTLERFGITERGCIEFYVTTGTCSGNVVQDVTIYDTDGLQNHAFASLVDIGCTMVDLKFIRCNAYNVGGDGFDLWGATWGQTRHDLREGGGWQKNVLFEDCKALYCGFTKQSWDWIVGFDLAEQCNVQNVTLARCEASYSWESGFHLEVDPLAKDVLFKDCVANYNGQKYSDPRGAAWGKGFLWATEVLPTAQYPDGAGSDVTTINCTGVGNAGGFGGNCRTLYDYYSVAYTYKVTGTSVMSSSGATVFTGVTFTEALQWACSHADAEVYVPAGTYDVTGRISIATGVTLYGQMDYHLTASEKTVFRFPGVSENEGFLVSANNVHLAQFRIVNGNILVHASGGTTLSGVRLSGITAFQAASTHSGAIEIYATAGSTVDGLVMRDVTALDAHTNGFVLRGDGTSTCSVNGLKMQFCMAKSCGLVVPRQSEPVYGFLLGSGIDIHAATLSCCCAESNYCSGFYFSPGVQMDSVVLQNCSAISNGQSGDPTKGMGYQMNGYSTIQLNGCSGCNNNGALFGT